MRAYTRSFIQRPFACKARSHGSIRTVATFTLIVDSIMVPDIDQEDFRIRNDHLQRDAVGQVD